MHFYFCLAPGGFPLDADRNFERKLRIWRSGAPIWGRFIETTIFDEIQVFLLVRGGLWREILVKNCILNFESAFLAKNDIF